MVPSSRYLGATMAKWLPGNPESYVLELGPGTGAVTEALFKRGLRQDRLIAIEFNPNLAKRLRQRYPAAQIIHGDAWQLDRLLAGLPQPVTAVGAVISSLPLLNFSPAQADRLAQKIRDTLSPDGCWVQYSYHLIKRHSRGAGEFRLRASPIVWRNLPPARVHVLQK